MSRVNSRLTKSTQALNDSITKLESEYARHREKMGYSNVLDDNTLNEVLQQSCAGNNIFDNAAILEERINSISDLRADCEDRKTRRRSGCLYVAKLFPLVRLLADIGVLAAQVRFFAFVTHGV